MACSSDVLPDPLRPPISVTGWSLSGGEADLLAAAVHADVVEGETAKQHQVVSLPAAPWDTSNNEAPKSARSPDATDCRPLTSAFAPG